MKTLRQCHLCIVRDAIPRSLLFMTSKDQTSTSHDWQVDNTEVHCTVESKKKQKIHNAEVMHDSKTSVMQSRLERETCRSSVSCNGLYWTTRGYANSRTGRLADWATRGCHRRLRVLIFRWFGHLLRPRVVQLPCNIAKTYTFSTFGLGVGLHLDRLHRPVLPAYVRC